MSAIKEVQTELAGSIIYIYHDRELLQAIYRNAQVTWNELLEQSGELLNQGCDH